MANSSGLHARPGTELVQIAKGFEADVSIAKNGETVNGKSIIKLLKLGIRQGDEIAICCSGTDEQAAANAIRAYLESLSD